MSLSIFLRNRQWFVVVVDVISISYFLTTIHWFLLLFYSNFGDTVALSPCLSLSVSMWFPVYSGTCVLWPWHFFSELNLRQGHAGSRVWFISFRKSSVIWGVRVYVSEFGMLFNWVLVCLLLQTNMRPECWKPEQKDEDKVGLGFGYIFKVLSQAFFKLDCYGWKFIPFIPSFD